MIVPEEHPPLSRGQIIDAERRCAHDAHRKAGSVCGGGGAGYRRRSVAAAAGSRRRHRRYHHRPPGRWWRTPARRAVPAAAAHVLAPPAVLRLGPGASSATAPVGGWLDDARAAARPRLAGLAAGALQLQHRLPPRSVLDGRVRYLARARWWDGPDQPIRSRTLPLVAVRANAVWGGRSSVPSCALPSEAPERPPLSSGSVGGVHPDKPALPDLTAPPPHPMTRW